MYIYSFTAPLFLLLILFIIFVPRASAVFVGIYEPTKQKLLKAFPENLSALAHLVSEFKYDVFYIDASLENFNEMFRKNLMPVVKENLLVFCGPGFIHNIITYSTMLVLNNNFILRVVFWGLIAWGGI